ncbi:MAG TPA: LLM class flavin-dependent oxidoreductase [Novosphingobium sp.]|nr:LLM class flavin-dependent oxidoreductase [Novosphingobium sp.]
MFEDMKFCMCVPHDTSLDVAREWWRRMDELGFDYIGIADTPMLCREVYLSLATAAAATSRAKLLLMVTNPVTRDVSVAAGAMLALRDLAGDRLAYGYGAGDSSIVGVGLKTATGRQIAEYMQALREILGGDTAEYEGRQLKGAWSSWEPWRPDLWMAANGPNNLKTAARVADSVIAGGSLLPEEVSNRIAYIQQCAAEAGRDPSQIDIWHLVPVMPGDTLEEGFCNINLIAQAKSFVLHGDRGTARPQTVQDALRQIAPLYSVERHSRTNQEVWDIACKTGTVDYFVKAQGGLVGPVDFTDAVQRLSDAGAKNLILVPQGPKKLAGIELMADATVAKRKLPETAA